MNRQRARNRSRGGAAVASSGGAAKITFTDTFTGTDGSAPNVRWTGSPAGWEINTNHLRFTGASYGSILATCTAGDNTVDVDIDISSANSSFAAFCVGVDALVGITTGVYVQVDGTETLTIHQVVATVDTIIATDTGHTRLASASHVKVALVGTAVTVTVTGGGDPGTFSGTVAAGALNQTKVGLGMNTGKLLNFFDNFVLS